MADRIRTILSLFSGAVFALLLFWVTGGAAPWFALIVLGVWIAVATAALWRLSRFHRPYTSVALVALLVMIATAGLVTIIESHGFLVLVTIMGSLMLGYLTMISFVPFEDDLIRFKPVRRTLTMFLVFVVYAALTFGFSLSVFFPDIPFSFITIILGLCVSAITGYIWSLYDRSVWVQNRWWIGAFGITMMELIWIMHLLPFGYFASGLLVSWLWYVAQLLGRFHLSPQGILWKKQRLFLIANIVLYVLVLAFFVRWV
jgi:hypothetical protein